MTAAAIASKCLGALYRIPLTRILGAHGMGLFQSVFPMYALLITLTGGGLTAAVSKLTAENDGRGVCRTAIAMALCFSAPLVAIAAICSHFIAAAAGAPRAAVAFLLLLPGVPVSAVCAALRGYFQGLGNMVPSAAGQCIEQAAKFAAGILLAWTFRKLSVAAAVAGCAAGITFAELTALLYYALRYRKEQTTEGVPLAPAIAQEEPELHSVERAYAGIETLTEASAELVPPDVAERTERGSAFVSQLLKVALPVMLGLLVLPLCQVADSFIVVNLLMRSGVAQDSATALYGVVTGPVNALVNLPAVFTVGICGSLLPKVSSLIKRGISPAKTVGRVFAFSLSVSLVLCAGIALTAPLSLALLYGNSLGVSAATAAGLLRTASVSVLGICVMQTASAVLQGGGKAYVPALILAVSAAIKEVLQFILLPRVGIYGFVISTDIFYLTAALCDGIALCVFLHGYKRQKRTV